MYNPVMRKVVNEYSQKFNALVQQERAVRKTFTTELSNRSVNDLINLFCRLPTNQREVVLGALQ